MTTKQKEAARKNIKKAQRAWQEMTPRQRALAQPEGRARKKPGSTGKGNYYRIEIRPKSQFTSFRTHDVGGPGMLQRIAGHRSSGSWATATWLVEKNGAHLTADKQLVITDPGARTVLKSIRGPITHVKGDIFKAYPRKNVPEADKPTDAQKKARTKNIKKAQAARRQQHN